jgi:hypothetical protein
MASNSLTIERAGQFRIATFGPNHCGTLPYLTVKYRMVCQCAAKLDARGFLFDQVEVDRFFQRIERTDKSCEKLTMDSLTNLIAMIRKENPDCVINRMALTLSPEPFAASMTEVFDASKEWTEERIASLLAKNDGAVERAILAIWNRQTADEKGAKHTRHSNGIGFSGSDASLGSYYAQWLRNGRHLSGQHLAKARAMAQKYRKQLLSIALTAE